MRWRTIKSVLNTTSTEYPRGTLGNQPLVRYRTQPDVHGLGRGRRVPALDMNRWCFSRVNCRKADTHSNTCWCVRTAWLRMVQANHVLLKITEQLSLVSRVLGVPCHPKCRR